MITVKELSIYKSLNFLFSNTCAQYVESQRITRWVKCIIYFIPAPYTSMSDP